jgi:WD40 repeat protein
MLLSIAYQMADRHPGIRMSLLEAQSAGLVCGDEIADNIWNEVFAKSIFNSKISNRVQYWVLDALDECKADAMRDLVKFLASIPGGFHLRVFATSRPGIEPKHHFDKFRIADQLKLEPIMPADTQRDMLFYLEAHMDGFFISDPERRKTLQDKLLAKANDCFLWLNLVRQELEQTYSQNSIAEVLDEIPAEMFDLYHRCFNTLSKSLKRHDLLLSQALFMWVACAIRPLKLEEILSAIDMEPLTSGLDMRGLTPDELGHKIPGLCGYLLYVDHNNYIQFCHSTVRDFLLNQKPESNYTIESSAGHQKLLTGCLTCMEREMKRREPRSVKESRNPLKHKRSAFASYASIAFSEHLAASSSKSLVVLEAIFKFLSNNVHSWIEHVVSEQNSLDYLIRTAKNLRNYLERLKKHAPPLSIHFRTVEQWSTDLVRLVAKFGTNLKRYPGTIHTLIPSIAPKDSHLYRRIQDRSKGVEMFGPAGQSWNDCAAVIQSADVRVTALTCGRHLFVVGQKDGTITCYDHATCEQKWTIKHPPKARLSRKPSDAGDMRPNPVKLLVLNGTDTLLASACLQNIYLWSFDNELLQVFHIDEPCVLLTFSLDGKALIAVTRSSCIHRLDVFGETTDSSTLGRKINSFASNTGSKGVTLPRQAPLTAAISPDQSVLALLYRGRPIYLCSLEDDAIIGLCGRDVNSRSSNISVQSALFNPNQDLHLLAVSYQDGELALYDTLTQEELISVSGDAYTLASTPDGQTLGTGDTRGTISLWDFETLTLLYQIRSGLDEIRTLAFTGDNSRLVDLRDSKINVWEPSALVRKSVLEDASMSDALPLEAPVVGENEEIITLTAMCLDTNGDFVFAGRSDGSVAGYKTSTGLLHAVLFIHSGDLFVSAMAFKNGVIATADAGGRVLVHELQSQGEGRSFIPALILDIKQSEPIQRLVISEDGSRILIATASRAMTWNLDTRLQGTQNLDCSADSIQNWTWTTNAANLSAVVNSNSLPNLVTYDWESFGITHSAPLVEFPQRKVEGSTLIANETICETWDRYMVIYNSNSATLKTRSDMLVYDKLAARSQQSPQAPIFKLSADVFLTLIGIYSHNLVILDRELWVCSISLNEIARSKSKLHIKHHFFIPSDLLSGPSGLRPILSPLGHVVFAKEDQLAIIKGLA